MRHPCASDAVSPRCCLLLTSFLSFKTEERSNAAKLKEGPYHHRLRRFGGRRAFNAGAKWHADIDAALAEAGCGSGSVVRCVDALALGSP